MKSNRKQIDENVVLFVDDESYVLEAIKRALHNDGYKILTAKSGIEALRIASQNKIHVVVSDYNMPGMLGPELLEKIHQSQPHAIRVVLTGASDLKIVRGFMKRGKAMRYLLKPWDTDELRSTLSECFTLYSEAA